MKRLLATIPLWLTLCIVYAPAIPPAVTSLTHEAGTDSMVIAWDGNGGSTFTVSRSDESVTNWLAIATGLTEMVYTDAVVSASFAHYRIEEEPSGLLELTAIYPSDGTNIVIEWSGNPSNTFSVSRSDMTVTNWTTLATNLTSMVYTDTTAFATFAWYRVEGQEGDPPPIVYFEDDFEDGGKPGWVQVVYDSSSNTLWELGAPSNVGPPNANSGTNLYATNLDAIYGFGSDVGLLSPVIDLSSATTGTLHFAHWFNTEEDIDFLQVLVKDATGVTNLTGAALLPPTSGVQTSWTTEALILPAEALGQEVRFEFRFSSDFFFEFDGWYIDDVMVSD